MNPPIQAIILDIDGVIVGEKIGYNSPNPHPEVIKAMQNIQNSGIPIILCTAKPHFAISPIINDANLDNLHITDGGGVVIDPINNQVISVNTLESNIARKVYTKLVNHQIYTEIYTIDDYFIDISQSGPITKRHQHVIQKPPQILDNLLSRLSALKITKIMPIAVNESQKSLVNDLLAEFAGLVTVSWGVHPVILPLQFGIITAPGISKAVAAKQILDRLHINTDRTLGVGDSLSDWQFIQSCGYGAAMGNAHTELKDLVITKADHGFIAPTVDDNGILTIFKHFSLL